MPDFGEGHLYLQWGGDLPGGETWSCGIRMRCEAGTPNTADGATFLNDLDGAVRAYHADPATGIHPRAVLQYVKANVIMMNGLFALKTTNQSLTGAISGGGSTSGFCYPNQVCLVVSLTTAVTRGPAHRGRFFLPLPSWNLGADGAIAAASAQSTAASTTDFLSGIAAGAPGYAAAVFHRGSITSPAEQRYISGCEVGRVLDTQRRRRRSLAENYQTG